MVQRLSTLFVRTLRDNPADAEVPSHRLLVRAGYIRRAAPGGYTWLPLGYRVFQNVARVIREEMDAIGAQEVNFPAMLPKEPYEVTGRWTDYGDNLFRLQDRRKVDFLLGPTHEEMFTLLVKDLYSSYKDLPVWLYQIQNKFRDEARPRGGLLRGLSSRILQTEMMIETLAHRDMGSRLVSFLLILCRDFGSPSTDGVTIDLKLSHQAIAEAIGSTRVTVTRLLGDLRKQKMIAISKKRITVHNPIELGQQFA